MKMLRRNPSAPEPAPMLGPDSAAPGVLRRRVEVTIEREWALISSSSIQPTTFEGLCSVCGCEVLMVSPAAAAKIAGVSIRTIYRLVDEQKLHFLESPAGELYLCAQSIPAPYQPQAVPNQTLPPGDSR